MAYMMCKIKTKKSTNGTVQMRVTERKDSPFVHRNKDIKILHRRRGVILPEIAHSVTSIEV